MEYSRERLLRSIENYINVHINEAEQAYYKKGFQDAIDKSAPKLRLDQRYSDGYKQGTYDMYALMTDREFLNSEIYLTALDDNGYIGPNVLIDLYKDYCHQISENKTKKDKNFYDIFCSRITSDMSKEDIVNTLKVILDSEEL